MLVSYPTVLEYESDETSMPKFNFMTPWPLRLKELVILLKQKHEGVSKVMFWRNHATFLEVNIFF